ncbi:MAG TPA: helix-turn-helix domain-containing protein [Candidatus Dormibacteraeota bacterium]|nr:helix-turn-helix domain-containing protein [Candidatus Dormibacteraeota bacterium]
MTGGRLLFGPVQQPSYTTCLDTKVARLLGIGRTKVYELIGRGELPVVRIGRLVRVPRAELERWIRDRVVGVPASGSLWMIGRVRVPGR